MQLELKRIQREVGITFVFVTHDQGEALTMSDRIAVMSEGVVEQIGTPEEIYDRPATLFVAGFIGSANLLPGTASGHDGDDVVVELKSGPTVRATPGRLPTNGDPVSVMIRPERLQVAVTAGPDGRSIEGVIRQLIFQGASARLQLEFARRDRDRHLRRSRRRPAVPPPRFFRSRDVEPWRRLRARRLAGATRRQRLRCRPDRGDPLRGEQPMNHRTRTRRPVMTRRQLLCQGRPARRRRHRPARLPRNARLGETSCRLR